MSGRAKRIELIRHIIVRTIAELPPSLKEALDRHGVTIEILSSPPPDVGPDVFGTFSGATVYDHESVWSGPSEPPRIELYLSSFDDLSDGAQALENEVRMTVIHEIGHFIGFEEDYLEDV